MSAACSPRGPSNMLPPHPHLSCGSKAQDSRSGAWADPPLQYLCPPTVTAHHPPPPHFRRPGLGPTTAPSVRPYVLLSRSLPPFPRLARHTHSSSSSAVSPEQIGDSSRDMQVSANSAQRSWVIREISGQNAVPLGSHTLIDLQSHVLSEDSSHLISKM